VDKFAIKDWLVWPSQSYSGTFNMEADHALAREMTKTLRQPLLRFFTWKPYCISLGYHQKPEEIDIDLCRQQNVDLVRRPTGGRAILHAEELTYSVVYPFEGIDVTNFYRLVHLPFVRALQNCGINAEFEKTQADFRQAYKTEKSQICFATSAQNEVEIAGKKLIGSAQRIYEKAILQHGSVLLGKKHEELVDFLKLPADSKNRIKTYIRDHTATVWDYTPGLKAERLSQKVREQFEEIFDISFTDINQNKEMISLLNSIPEKYKTEIRLN
jgi:lipoate-protein ligase A